ncbi:hypothetical protein OROMI_004011 [Orobanche minor]
MENLATAAENFSTATPLNPDPGRPDVLPADDTSDRHKKRRTNDSPTSTVMPMGVERGETWAEKVSPKRKEDFRFEDADSDEIQKVKIIKPRGTGAIPEIWIADDLMETINNEWMKAIIVKIPGRLWPVDLLKGRLGNLWGIQGHFELIDVAITWAPQMFKTGLAQCSRDLTFDDCRGCLNGAVKDLPGITDVNGTVVSMSVGARRLAGSCSVRYETHQFLNYN